MAPNHTEKCFPDMVIGWSFFLILLPKPVLLFLTNAPNRGFVSTGHINLNPTLATANSQNPDSLDQAPGALLLYFVVHPAPRTVPICHLVSDSHRLRYNYFESVDDTIRVKVKDIFSPLLLIFKFRIYQKCER